MGEAASAHGVGRPVGSDGGQRTWPKTRHTGHATVDRSLRSWDVRQQGFVRLHWRVARAGGGNVQPGQGCGRCCSSNRATMRTSKLDILRSLDQEVLGRGFYPWTVESLGAAGAHHTSQGPTQHEHSTSNLNGSGRHNLRHPPSALNFSGR